MAFDLATAKKRLGIADALQDAEVNLALNAALAFAEHYCDRRFVFARETLTKYVDRDLEGIFVDRYPIVKIHSIDSNAGIASQAMHSSSGVVFIKDRYSPFRKAYDTGSKITIDYEGGYKALPADLEFCMWQIFSSVWPTYDPSLVGGGGGAGGGAGPAIGSVKKRTIVGVGSVEYETGGSSSSSSSSGSVAADWSAVLPGAVQAVLGLYMRRVA